MKYNQEILRKHTALTVSRKDVDTSLLMFPVRLETRFVEGKRVDDISEPHRVLYAYKAIWNYVRLRTRRGCAIYAKPSPPERPVRES